MLKTKSKDGTVLAYDKLGSGPPLIFITGASCFRKFIPIVQDAKVFAKEFTVYNYDRRGRGDSGNATPWSLEREVEDVDAMIDAAGGSAYLYGHSSGGVLALEASLSLKSKIKKVIIYDPPYVHNQKEKTEYGRLSQIVIQLLDQGANGQAMKVFLNGIGMPKILVHLLPLAPGWAAMKALAPTLAYDIALTGDLPPIARAANVTVPIKIIVGQKSPAGMHEVASQLVKAIPNATFLMLMGQDHMVSAKSLLPIFSSFYKTEAPN
jgi:pimeloyl-ACP methyl ester carboxylesterase